MQNINDKQQLLRPNFIERCHKLRRRDGGCLGSHTHVSRLPNQSQSQPQKNGSPESILAKRRSRVRVTETPSHQAPNHHHRTHELCCVGRAIVTITIITITITLSFDFTIRESRGRPGPGFRPGARLQLQNSRPIRACGYFMSK